MNCKYEKEILLKYAYGLLDDNNVEYFNAHLADCSSCKMEIEKLTKFRSDFQKYPVVSHNSDLKQKIILKISNNEINTDTVQEPNFDGNDFEVSFYFNKMGFISATVSIILIALIFYYFIFKIDKHSTVVYANDNYIPGEYANISILSRNLEGENLKNCKVEILIEEWNKKIKIYDGKISEKGSTVARFKMPDVAEGKYNLQIKTISEAGESIITKQIGIYREHKILLTTDKPVYQPKQTIYIRALVLDKITDRARNKMPVTIEVTDADGTKFFKQKKLTSKFGIVSAECPLSDLLKEGNYKVKIIVGNTSSEKEIEIKTYKLPKFTISVNKLKKEYSPLEKLKLKVTAKYLYGKFLNAGSIKITLSAYDVEFKNILSKSGKINESGNFETEITLPDYFVGLPVNRENAVARLKIEITDNAGYNEILEKDISILRREFDYNINSSDTATALELDKINNLVVDSAINVIYYQIPLNNRPFKMSGYYSSNTKGILNISIIPRNEFIVTNTVNQFYLFLSNSKREPIENANIKILYLADSQTIKTGKLGIAEFFLNVPDSYNFVTIETIYKESDNDYCEYFKFNINNNYFNVSITTDKEIYKPGDSINGVILSSNIKGSVFIDIIKSGNTIYSDNPEIINGLANFNFDLPQDIYGVLTIVCYQFDKNGNLIRNSRNLYVENRKDLKIEILNEKKIYMPGQDAVLDLSVKNSFDTPVTAALGLSITDLGITELSNRKTGLFNFFFDFEKELLAPKADIEKISIFQSQKNFSTDSYSEKERSMVINAALAVFSYKEKDSYAHNDVIEKIDKLQKKKLKQKTLLIKIVLFIFIIFLFSIYKENRDIFYNLSLLLLTLESFFSAIYINYESLEIPVILYAAILTLSNYAFNRIFYKTDIWIFNIRIHSLFFWFANISFMILFYDINTAKIFYKITVIPLFLYAVFVLSNFKKIMAPFLVIWFVIIIVNSISPIKNTGFIFLYLWLTFIFFAIVLRRKIKDIFISEKFNAKLKSPGIFVSGCIAICGLLVSAAIVYSMFFPMFNLADIISSPHDIDYAASNSYVAANISYDFHNVSADLKESKENWSDKTQDLHIRKWFPETLLFIPEVITDENGFARKTVKLADSITSWNLKVSANTIDGGLGAAEDTITVFQDFFIDADLPLFLTRKDIITIPVTITNYLNKDQNISVSLFTDTDKWFKIIDSKNSIIRVSSQNTVKTNFRIQVLKCGLHKLKIYAEANSGFRDAVIKEIDIKPEGIEKSVVTNGWIRGSTFAELIVPDNTVKDSERFFVKIFANSFNTVIDGLDGIFRMPHGCFEQTSSITYPNVLALMYLKSKKAGSQEILRKAENYINLGYQRLLTFEVNKSGGFSYYGEAPALAWLTAYALLEFSDMSKLMNVDENLINRIKNTIYSSQFSEGYWDNKIDLNITAYVCYALAEAGYYGDNLSKGLKFLEDRYSENTDVYICALALNAILKTGGFDSFREKLNKKILKLYSTNQNYFLDSNNAKSLSGASGQSYNIETKSLIALALLKQKTNPEIIDRIIKEIISEKSADGFWYSTQATCLAIKALLEADKNNSSFIVNSDIAVEFNSNKICNYKITPENSDVTAFIDLKKFSKPGPNKLLLKSSGSNVMFQFTGIYNIIPASNSGNAITKPIEIFTKYDRTELKVRDILNINVTIKNNSDNQIEFYIIDLGIPAGFSLNETARTQLAGIVNVNKVEVMPRQIILYMSNLQKKSDISFSYNLQALFPIRISAPENKVYDYYNPDISDSERKGELTINGLQ